jgi:hypothetical protein
MRPWLASGTDVLIRLAPDPARVRAGDVLVFRLGDAWAAHRALRSGRAARGGRLAVPTRGDWTGRPDPAGPAGGLIGRVAYARIGGRWWRVEGAAARLAGLATNAGVALLARIGGRSFAAEGRRALAARR